MMCGMQAPKQPYFVGQKMIDEVRKFPNDVSINKPIPGERGGYQGDRGKQTNAKSGYAERNIAARYPVEGINKERNFVFRGMKFFVGQSHRHFKDDNKRNEG